MKKFLVLFLILCTSSNANEEQKFFDLLKGNDKILWLRHFSAPGGGDPDNFDVRVRSTQRNLGKFGIKQGKAYKDGITKSYNQDPELFVNNKGELNFVSY